MTTRRPRLLRVWVPVLATLAIVVPLAWLWQASRVPSSYSLLDMGYLDYGGGPQPDPSVAGHTDHGGGNPHAGHVMKPITELVADPSRPADVRVDLTAAAATLDIGGHQLAGFTLNGSSPGPTITAVEGQLVEVHLRNDSVAGGVTLHWHGVDVPNAMDGVAGVTQDAVPVGGEFTYRFVAGRPGTYWYHSHQVADPQVRGGLLGGLVITPKISAGSGSPPMTEVLAVAHTYGATRTINGRVGDLAVPAKPGERVRLRIVNTDNAPMPIWSDAGYRVLAVDGTDVHEPSPVEGKGLVLTGGGRYDLELTVPASGSARVQLSRATAVVVGDGTSGSVPPQPTESVDLLSYGTPAPLSFDPATAARHFDYRIGRRPGFVKGRPGLFWSINGHLYPNVPMYVVREGEVVAMHIANSSGQVHPMHLHGHHAVVTARNGVAATGSPWWVDSLNVEDGESYDIAFVADNPGLWMDHCHNLEHAADGMVAHLMYEGWDTPFRIGGTGRNRPE